MEYREYELILASITEAGCDTVEKMLVFLKNNGVKITKSALPDYLKVLHVQKDGNTYSISKSNAAKELGKLQKRMSQGSRSDNYPGFNIMAGVLVKYTGQESEPVIPDCVVEIAEKAFYRKTIEKLTIPPTVKALGPHAFAECKSLVELVFDCDITRLPENLCNHCELLETVVLPQKLTHIGEQAFHECISLRQISLPDKLQVIGDCAFNKAPIKEIVIPETVREIGHSAFWGSLIETIEIPDACKYLGSTICTPEILKNYIIRSKDALPKKYIAQKQETEFDTALLVPNWYDAAQKKKVKTTIYCPNELSNLMPASWRPKKIKDISEWDRRVDQESNKEDKKKCRTSKWGIKEVKNTFLQPVLEGIVRWKSLFELDKGFSEYAPKLVWEANEKRNVVTYFTFSAEGKCIDANGSEIVFPNTAKVCMAYGPEMSNEQRNTWKKYFSSANIAQPIEQLYADFFVPDEKEFKVNGNNIAELNRYEGITLYYGILKECLEPPYFYENICDYDERLNIDIFEWLKVWTSSDISFDTSFYTDVKLDKIIFEYYQGSGWNKPSRKINHFLRQLDLICLKDAIYKGKTTLLEERKKFLMNDNIDKCIAFAEKVHADDCLAWLKK